MKRNSQNLFSRALRTISVLTLLFFASSGYSQCPTFILIENSSNCIGDSTGVLTVVANSEHPLMITEIDRTQPDFIEIQNVSGSALDLTGYYVACSDSYTNINFANTLTWDLSGVVPAGWIDYRDDYATSGNYYWGSNMLFHTLATTPGWVAICDSLDNVVDIVFWGWNAGDITSFAPNVGGTPLNLDPAQWVGDGIQGACETGSMSRSTNLENNNAADWACGTTSTAGTSNVTISPVITDPISTILWNTTATSASISGLSAGTYSVQVDYMSGCVAYDTVALLDPVQLTGTSVTTDILCYGEANGTATINTTGGTGTINVDWGMNDPTMLGLGYSSYTMIDSLGCTESDSVLINEPSLIDITLTGQSIACFGDIGGGSADAVVTGGMPGYSYIWSNGDTTSNATALSAGWHGVSVSDQNGCVKLDSVEITEPPMMVLDVIVNDEVLGSDGSIDLTVSGGTPPYSYSWTNGAGSVQDPTSLIGGLYEVTVTDSVGCVITGTYTINSEVGINELSELHFSIFPNPNNGSFDIFLDPSAGISNLEVLNSLGQVIYENEFLNSKHRVDLEAVQAGIYFIRIYNANASNVARVVVK